MNYSCPEGSGLDGIPYRVCTEDLVWKPDTRVHTCISANLYFNFFCYFSVIFV